MLHGKNCYREPFSDAAQARCEKKNNFNRKKYDKNMLFNIYYVVCVRVIKNQ